MITDVDKIDRIAKKIVYRHRIKKRDIFLNTKLFPVVSARYHFFTLCHDEGIRIVEIQRYCERYGYPIDHATIIRGINKIKKYEESLISNGSTNVVRAISKAELAKDKRRARRVQGSECDSL
jgi:hypothetical protein